MTRTIYEQIVEIASDNHSYVTAAQAAAAGIDPAQLRIMASRGKLKREAHGVYRVLALPRTEHDEYALAVAWSGGKGVVSHESGLALHQVSDVNPSRLHMTIQTRSYPRSNSAGLYKVHCDQSLKAEDITEIDGIPVTVLQRTIEDCITAGSDPFQIQNAIENGKSENLLTQLQADKLLSRNNQRF